MTSAHDGTSADPLTNLFKSTSSSLKSLSSLADLRESLSTLLHSLSLPTTPSAHHNSNSNSDASTRVLITEKNIQKLDKLVPALQTVLLEWVLPSWWDAIKEERDVREMVERCFASSERCEVGEAGDGALESGKTDTHKRSNPGRRSLCTQIRNRMILSAHLVLSSSISSNTTPPLALPGIIHLSTHLVSQSDLTSVYHHLYPLDRRRTSNFVAGGSLNGLSIGTGKSDLMWAELIKAITSWPVRVGNAWGKVEDGGKGIKGNAIEGFPTAMESRAYFDRFVVQLEELLYRVRDHNSSELDPLRDLLVKLHRIGLLNPPSPRLDHSPSPSFFTPMISSLLGRLHRAEISANSTSEEEGSLYPAKFWPDLLEDMPYATQRAFVQSFFLHLAHNLPVIVRATSPPIPSSIVRAAAILLERFVGKPVADDEVWRLFVDGIVLGRTGLGREVASLAGNAVEGKSSGEEVARVVVAWVTRGGEKAIKGFLESTLASWGDVKEIKYTTYGRQIFLTHLLMLTLSQLRPMHPIILNLAFDSTVLQSIQHYLSHSDAAIRRLGMLVAEVISQLSVPSSTLGSSSSNTKSEQTNAELQKELEGLLGELEAEEGGKIKPPAEKPAPAGQRKEMKRLDFGAEMWAGKGQGKEECRRLRSFLGLRDSAADLKGLEQADYGLGWGRSDDDGGLLGVGEPPGLTNDTAKASAPADRGRPTNTAKKAKSDSKPKPKPRVEVDSDDDSLIGYSSASSPSSSRSPSPTPSYLEEITQDPSLHTSNRAKIQRPVYITQLLDLLRASKEPDKLEVALRWGESLIRRKRDFGGELQENAVALGVQILSLNDNFNLDDFETKRQGMLIALTSCCPKLVAPFLAQQYFEGEYSLLQRSTILSGLAMGARELACLATVQAPSLPSVDFPSKMMPEKMHRRYVTAGDVRTGTGLLEVAAGQVRAEVLDSAKVGTADMVPKELVRTRRLRPVTASTKGKIEEVNGNAASRLKEAEEYDRFSLTAKARSSMPAPIIPYSDVAGEYFILPMINRFWIYFQDEAIRETRTQKAYGGAGMILSALAMGKFLATLSIMIHAARHSSLFLSVIAPEGLELAVTIGSRLAQKPEAATLVGVESKEKEFEADVVGAALELALVCLDGSKELDNGRTMATDKATVLMAAGEWASGLFEMERKGESVAVNSGGQREGRTRKAAAGVVVLVAGIVERMR